MRRATAHQDEWHVSTPECRHRRWSCTKGHQERSFIVRYGESTEEGDSMKCKHRVSASGREQSATFSPWTGQTCLFSPSQFAMREKLRAVREITGCCTNNRNEPFVTRCVVRFVSFLIISEVFMQQSLSHYVNRKVSMQTGRSTPDVLSRTVTKGAFES